MEPLDIPHAYCEYLSSKNELEDLHSAIQRVFADEIADGKIALIKTKKVQIPVFHGLTDLQIRIKVWSIENCT